MKVRTEQRSGDWYASIEGEPGNVESGATEVEAIGKLVVSHASRFNIVVESAEMLAKRQLQADLKRLITLLPRWHRSDTGAPTPIAKREGGADMTYLKGDETFCLCGLALLAVEFPSAARDDNRLTALFGALRTATGTIKEHPPGDDAGKTLGEWSDAKGRTVGHIEAAVKKALKSSV